MSSRYRTRIPSLVVAVARIEAEEEVEYSFGQSLVVDTIERDYESTNVKVIYISSTTSVVVVVVFSIYY